MIRSPPASSLRCRRVAFADFGDAAIGEGDPAALDHAIGQHDAGVAEDRFRASVDLIMLFLQAAAANDVTSTIRSAISSRTSSSWTIATIATPLRFFSSISSTTTARLAASSEAVGSSSSRIGRSEMKPRAMLTRCCSPPEKVDGGSAHSRSGMLRRRSSCARPLARLLARDAVRDQRLGHHVERGDARHRAQELADIADGGAAHAEDLPRFGAWRDRSRAPWWRMPMRPPSQR